MQLAAISATHAAGVDYIGAMNATQTIIPCGDPTDEAHADANHHRRRTDSARQRLDEQDNLLSARSVLISVVIGAALWAVILTAGWLIFR